MKKSVLLSSALLVGVGVFAQVQRQAPQRNEAYKVSKLAKVEPIQVNTQGLQPKAGNHNSVMVAPPYSKFSSQRNAFGFIESSQNCLSWNQDLNCRIVPASNAGLAGYSFYSNC